MCIVFEQIQRLHNRSQTELFMYICKSQNTFNTYSIACTMLSLGLTDVCRRKETADAK